MALIDELLGDVVPIAQAALHDALYKADLLQGGPIGGEQRKLEVVVDVVIVACLVLWEVLADFS